MTSAYHRHTSPAQRGRLLDLAPVIPVVVVDAVEQAVPLARALGAAAYRVIEITLRSAAGLGAIEAVAVRGRGHGRRRRHGHDAGAGPQVYDARRPVHRDARARRRGCSRRSLDSGLPLLAGAATLTEMLRLAEAGLEAMKFFPAEASGGRPYLSAVAGPCPHLRFCPTGGITPDNAADWLALPNVGCVGGSWLTPKDAVAQGTGRRIEALAARRAAPLRG